MKNVPVVLTLLLLSTPALAADTQCKGAEGDHATAPGSKGGVPLPAKRSCINPDIARLVGGKAMDMPAGMVVDSKGNAYVAGETKSFNDTFYGDIFVAKIKPDGALGWFVTYGGKEDDGIHQHDENTEGDGPEAMIDIDEKDNVYVVGRGKSVDKIYAGIALKLSPEGKLLWSRFYRPQWQNRAITAAEFHAVDVHKGVVHIVGVTSGESQVLAYALDANTGNTLARLALDPSPGSNDRFYSVVADPSGGAIYAAGWSGSGPQGLIARLDFNGKAYSLGWMRKVPLPRGSNFPSLAVDPAGGLYAVADIHGASTWSELHKYDASTGKMTWARRYNSGVSNDKTQTHVVKVQGPHILLAGKVGFTGTATHVDSMGDGFVLQLDADGNLKREYFFFTGTNPKSFDAVKDVELHGKDLHVVGWHFGPATIGEWRVPADYDEIKHAWTEADRRDYRSEKVEPAVDVLAKSDVKDGTTLKAYRFDDEVGDSVYVEAPKKGLARPASTSMYYFVFRNFLP